MVAVFQRRPFLFWHHNLTGSTHDLPYLSVKRPVLRKRFEVFPSRQNVSCETSVADVLASRGDPEMMYKRMISPNSTTARADGAPMTYSVSVDLSTVNTKVAGTSPVTPTATTLPPIRNSSSPILKRNTSSPLAFLRVVIFLFSGTPMATERTRILRFPHPPVGHPFVTF